MKRAILEIQNKNILSWKQRERADLKERENLDKIETDELEKEKRLNKAEGKWRESIRNLRKTGIMEKERNGEKWINERKVLLREIQRK